MVYDSIAQCPVSHNCSYETSSRQRWHTTSKHRVYCIPDLHSSNENTRKHAHTCTQNTQECKLCQRDMPGQYNSIYRSCNGTDKEDVIVCALNQQGSTFPGDACPEGHFAYGRLDAIDTELRRMDSASWPLPQSLSWSTVYNAVIQHVSRFNPVLQDGGYMIVSKTVRNMATSTDIASNTRTEVFKGEVHLYKTAANLGNMFEDPVSSLTGTGGSSNRRSSAVSEPYEGLPRGMQSIIVPKDKNHNTGSRRQYTTSTMIVDKPSSMRSMFFSPTLSTIYMIAGTDPLQNSVLDSKPVLRSIYSLSMSESAAKWVLVFDGGPVAADIVQMQACTGIINTNPDTNNKGIVACSYTDRFSTLKLFRLAIENRHAYSLLWQNATMPAPGSAPQIHHRAGCSSKKPQRPWHGWFSGPGDGHTSAIRSTNQRDNSYKRPAVRRTHRAITHQWPQGIAVRLPLVCS
jgi:hypothetical protein